MKVGEYKRRDQILIHLHFVQRTYAEFLRDECEDDLQIENLRIMLENPLVVWSKTPWACPLVHRQKN